MSGTKKYSTLPENADKILFVEDFVNHILLKLKLPVLSSGIADHRDRVLNAFNPEVKLAADYCYNVQEDDTLESFEDIFKQNRIDHDAFLEYFTSMKSLADVFDASENGVRDLIEICVRMSLMAGKFYMHGCIDAPDLAVDYIISIINDIDMVAEGGWDALNRVAANWSRFYIDTHKNYLTPDSQSEYESDSLNSKNSEDSRSPDHDMDGREGQGDNPEELTDDKLCIAAISSSSEEPVSSSYDGEHVEKRYDVKAGSITNFSDNTSDSVSSGSSKQNDSESPFHSFEGSSSEDDSSKQMIQVKRNKMPSCSYSKDSDGDSKRCKTDLETADDNDPFGTH